MRPNHPLYRFVKSFVSFVNNEQVIKSRPLKGITAKFHRNLEEIHINKDSTGRISGHLIHNKQKFDINVEQTNIIIETTPPAIFKLSDVSGLNNHLESLYNTN
ncbi:hypothetical protein [Aeromonas phage AerS_266]|nr:hypothetical protein [Aeromonas phage AerS_266]